MSEPTSKTGWLRFRFGLRTLLLLMLLVSVFFAGRMSLQRELDKARREADELRTVAERAAMRSFLRPIVIPQVDPRVDEGMMIDAIETQAR